MFIMFLGAASVAIKYFALTVMQRYMGTPI
jgi:hypothetical protein